MTYKYRIMMTELCEIPVDVMTYPGCTQGYSELSYLIDETVYATFEEAAYMLSCYRSVETGIVMDRSRNKVRGVREYFIEQIAVDELSGMYSSYGGVKYADFEKFESYIPSICSDPAHASSCFNKGSGGILDVSASGYNVLCMAQ